MWVWVDRLSGVLLDAGLAALVLWALTALALLGNRQPARRLRLARAATAAALVLGPLVGSGLVPRFTAAHALETTGLLPHPLLTPGWVIPEPADAGAADLGGGGGAGSGGVAPAPDWAARGLTVAYLVGVVGGLGWLALGCLALNRLAGRSVASSPETQALYDRLAFVPGRRRPRLRVAARVGRPVLAGLLRPVILIPPELDRPEAGSRLRLGLLHELAHAESRDTLHGAALNLARALWFFAPPLWWVAAQVALDQEFLADRRAARGFGPPRDYALGLLEFATTGAAAPALGGGETPGPEKTGSPLFQRVLMLLKCPFPVEPHPPAWWSWGIPCLTVAMTLGVSSVSLRPLPPAPPATGPGLGPKPGPAPAHAFRVSRLETWPSPAGALGRTSPLELPVRLPERFDLTVEVWGDPASLAQTRVSGVRLGAPGALRPPEPERWHLVCLRRNRAEARLWVDGEELPLDRNPPAFTSRLTVEPPAQRSSAFRALTLRWSS